MKEYTYVAIYLSGETQVIPAHDWVEADRRAEAFAENMSDTLITLTRLPSLPREE